MKILPCLWKVLYAHIYMYLLVNISSVCDTAVHSSQSVLASWRNLKYEHNSLPKIDFFTLLVEYGSFAPIQGSGLDTEALKFHYCQNNCRKPFYFRCLLSWIRERVHTRLVVDWASIKSLNFVTFPVIRVFLLRYNLTSNTDSLKVQQEELTSFSICENAGLSLNCVY